MTDDLIERIDTLAAEPRASRGPHPVVADMAALLERAPGGKRRVDKDSYGLVLAFAAAMRADCTRRRVGAVVVNGEGRLVGSGYNGLAPGKPGCASSGACPRGLKSYAEVPTGIGAANYSGGPGECQALHAEMNAVVDAGRPRTKGCTLFVTCEPCPLCRTVIRAAGISRVVWPEGEWIP